MCLQVWFNEFYLSNTNSIISIQCNRWIYRISYSIRFLVWSISNWIENLKFCQHFMWLHWILVYCWIVIFLILFLVQSAPSQRQSHWCCFIWMFYNRFTQRKFMELKTATIQTMKINSIEFFLCLVYLELIIIDNTRSYVIHAVVIRFITEYGIHTFIKGETKREREKKARIMHYCYISTAQILWTNSSKWNI